MISASLLVAAFAVAAGALWFFSWAPRARNGTIITMFWCAVAFVFLLGMSLGALIA